MKKKSTLLLVIPACAMFLAGCDANSAGKTIRETVGKGVKWVVHKLDDFFKEGAQTAYTLSYHL